LFAWDAALAPYLELAFGIGRASVETGPFAVRASQLVGRVGLGLELRLGRHVVLESQAASVHRLRLDGGAAGGVTGGAAGPALAQLGKHERSVELRGGLALRF
jgi:hypothetical protein